MQWIVTSACDLHCPHCYSGAGRRGTAELTTEEAKRLLIDELTALGKPTFVLAGGELLLRKDIPEIVEYTCERGLPWAMHTHGLHVPRFQDLFRRHPPSLAAISLDGQREEHDAFRGRKGSFDGALAAMRILKEEGCPEVVAGTTITRQNADRIEELFPTVRSSGADSWGLHLFAPEGRGQEHLDLMPTPDQLRRVAAFAREARKEFHVELCNEWGSAGADDSLYRDQPFLCGAGRVSFVVAAGGEVLPCTTTDLRESEGNLRETPLRRIWSQRFVRFRSAGHGPCSEGGECWLQTRNGVHCSRDAFGDAVASRGSLAPALLDHLPLPSPTRDVNLVSERAARILRAAALAVVLLEGVSLRREMAEKKEDSSPAAPRQDQRPFPPLTEKQILHHQAALSSRSAWTTWLTRLRASGNPGESALATAKLLDPQTPLAKQVVAHTERRLSLQGDSIQQLTTLLDTVEMHSIFDPLLVEYLWRRTRDLPLVLSPAEAGAARRLYSRLEQHLRIASALAASSTISTAPHPGAWRSKAAPPVSQRPVKASDVLKEAKKAYEKASSAAFTGVGAVSLKLVSGSVTLQRPTEAKPLQVGTQVKIERLDWLQTSGGCAFEHAELGTIRLEAGAQVNAYQLQRRLSPEALRKLDELIALGAKQDAEALRKLGTLAELATVRIRLFLEKNPEAPGAEALRAVAQAGGD